MISIGFSVLFPSDSVSIEGHHFDDSYFPDQDADFVMPFRCAMADGAHITSSARNWARLLTRSFVSNDWDLGTIRSKWLQFCNENQDMNPSAMAAFLGLSFTEAGALEAIAAGDCCLIQVNGDGLKTSFPMDNRGEFLKSPELLFSTSSINDAHMRSIGLEYAAGDSFYLMTDGFGKILLPMFQDYPIADELNEMSTEELCEWAYRTCTRFRSDKKYPFDTSLLRIKLTTS